VFTKYHKIQYFILLNNPFDRLEQIMRQPLDSFGEKMFSEKNTSVETYPFCEGFTTRKKPFRWVGIVEIVVIFCVFCTGFTGAHPGGTLSVNSPVNVENGTTFPVTVTFTNDNSPPVNNFGFDIQYDNTKIQYVTYDAAITAGVPNANAVSVSTPDASLVRVGWVSNAGSWDSNVTPGASTLAIITFRAIKPDSTSQLHFTGINFFDMDGNPSIITPTDGTFTTGQGPAGTAQAGLTTAEPETPVPQPSGPEPAVPLKTSPVLPSATRTPLDIVVVAGALATGVALFARKRW